jgi:hypothetical protein
MVPSVVTMRRCKTRGKILKRHRQELDVNLTLDPSSAAISYFLKTHNPVEL